MAQVHDLDTVETQIQTLSQFHDHLVVTQQNGVADTLSLSLHSSLQHGGVNSLCKHHSLRMGSSCSVELLRQFGLLSEQYRQRVLIFVPILNRLTGYTTLDSSLGHCR